MPKMTMPKPTFVSIALNTQHALWPLISYSSMVGLKFDARQNPVVLDGIEDLSMLTLQTVLGVVQYGGEVYDFPAWIVIADADMGDAVPDTLPHSDDTTWENWHDATHEHYQFGDNWYIQGCSWGEHLLGSQLLALVSSGLTVVDTAGYLAAQAAAEGGE